MGGAGGSYWAICWLFYVQVLFIRHSGPRLYPLTKSVGLQTSSMSCPPTYDAHKNIRWFKTRWCVLRRCGFRRPYCRGSLPNSLGCSLDPPPFASAIKCHQKSTSNSAGSSVGSLAPPRATPRLGGVYVSCQYFPCSFVLALRELGLRLGVKAQLPLRASSRGVLPGPGALTG